MRKVRAALIILSLMIVLSVIFAGHGEIDLDKRLLAPSANFIFGTDSFGRALLPRICYGLLVSLSIGAVASTITIAISILIALLLVKAGYKLSVFILSLLDSIKVIPSVVLALFLAAITGEGAMNVIFVLVLAFISNAARTEYASMKSLYKMDYIEAEYSIGCGEGRLFFSHILKAMLPYLKEEWISLLLSSILIESSLSFLGAGVKANTPSIGAILQEARPYILTSPYMVIIPSLVLIALSASLLMLSEGLSELDSTSHRA